MNALKHIERIFGVVLLAAVGIAAMPARQAAPAQAAARALAQPQPQPIHVTVVKGKRITDVEKRASLGAEPLPESNGS